MRGMVAALTILRLSYGADGGGGCAAADGDPNEVAAKLIGLKSSVLKTEEAAAAGNMLQNDILARMRVACQQQAAAFERVLTQADWEKFRDERLALMQRSFGSGGQPLVPAALPKGAKASDGGYEITATVEGEGFRVENLVIAGRPGLPITANLYVPATPPAQMPGILVVTSHHNAKGQGELQDMGMTWARQGCLVLVLDNIGYGERRQQLYGGREDYRWRYHMGKQLHTTGESLMGWMVADLRRGLDVLTARTGVDLKRIIALGSVAGGGDLSGVLAATDPRVTCSIPYNYGSAAASKPATPNAAEWVNFIGGGDADAVRCLRNKGRDDFNNWMLVAATAPRHTIFAKEFDWQPAGDAGFARVARVFELYGARDHLDSTHGFGKGSQSSTEASHCNNVGAPHRKGLYPILERWMKMPVPAEYQKRLTPEQLTCLTPDAKARWQVQPVHEVLAELAARQVLTARAALAALPAQKRKEKLRRDWAARLGQVTPAAAPVVTRTESVEGERFLAERILLTVEPGIFVPVLLLKPSAKALEQAARLPVVIAVAQEGKDTFLAKRAAEAAELLALGSAVCVVDVRGTGETKPSGDRYWYSKAVEWASEDLQLGQTVLGSRVRDLRSVLRYLQSRPDVDGRRVAVWGDSFAPVNPPRFVDPPMKTENSALQAEPLGATAALLLALYEDDVRAVVARGGLLSYAALMDGPACQVVLDAIVPQVLETGDISALVAALAPLPVRLEALVDGRNRLAGQPRLDREFAQALEAYRARPNGLTLSPAASEDVAAWLGKALQE